MFINKIMPLFILLILISPTIHAAEISGLSRQTVYLNESNKTETIRLDVSTKNTRSFLITIQSDNTGSVHSSNNEFVLNPTLPNIDGNVRVAFDFPYLDRSESGLVRADTINRVVNQQQNRANDQFSLCPNSSRICKPLTVMVIDDAEAIPGIRYTATLTIIVESDDGVQPPSTRRLTLNYQKSGSAIGLKGSTNNVWLTPENDYSSFVDYCVFSMAYSNYQLAIESQRNTGSEFYLSDRHSNKLPYEIAVSLNNKPKTSVIQNQWMTNGLLNKARDMASCTGYNARIYFNIPKEALYRSTAGIYRDIVTVKVKGV